MLFVVLKGREVLLVELSTEVEEVFFELAFEVVLVVDLHLEIRKSELGMVYRLRGQFNAKEWID